MVGHLPLEEVILVRVQVWQQIKTPPREGVLICCQKRAKLLCSRPGLETLFRVSVLTNGKAVLNLRFV